jgi:hypothetical protein
MRKCSQKGGEAGREEGLRGRGGRHLIHLIHVG